jgi:hypothetical protein
MGGINLTSEGLVWCDNFLAIACCKDLGVSDLILNQEKGFEIKGQKVEVDEISEKDFHARIAAIKKTRALPLIHPAGIVSPPPQNYRRQSSPTANRSPQNYRRQSSPTANRSPQNYRRQLSPTVYRSPQNSRRRSPQNHRRHSSPTAPRSPDTSRRRSPQNHRRHSSPETYKYGETSKFAQSILNSRRRSSQEVYRYGESSKRALFSSINEDGSKRQKIQQVSSTMHIKFFLIYNFISFLRTSAMMSTPTILKITKTRNIIERSERSLVFHKTTRENDRRMRRTM